MSKRNIVKVILVFWFALCVIALIKGAGKYSFEDNVVMIALAIIPVIIFYGLFFKNIVKAKKKVEIENEKIRNLQNGLPILNVPSLCLGDAKVHYYEAAELLNTENKLIGLNNQSKGTMQKSLVNGEIFDLHVTKSSGTSQAVYDDVTSTYNGEFAITDKNIIFINSQKGFEIKMDDLAFAQAYSDRISLQSGKDTYQILLGEPKYCMAILNQIRSV